MMTVLFGTHPEYLEHDTGLFHPESASRLETIASVVDRFKDGIVSFQPSPASAASITSVHDGAHVAEIRQLCLMGGGPVDADTQVGYQSYDIALLAAGAGLDAIARLQRQEGDAAFVAVRPPGHHATSDTSMGFCLFNNIAVAAQRLLDQGERVLILDIDAHHGNGTQDIFYSQPSVLYVSIHQYPLYPGTGKVFEIGDGNAIGTTINIPLPPRTNGATALAALESIAAPSIRRFAPTWLLISAGFDGHKDDPLTDLGYSANDYHHLTRWALQFVPNGRTVAFLEGGYDLAALAESTAASIAALLGISKPFDSADPTGKVETELIATLARMREEALLLHGVEVPPH
ncbi:histone deacetylase [Ferrimicrobium sp.]|uniref:histone deacetylase family protein n=1 Tax=Ferrimicrobium sp. TaxID=2926050 RepID=UPI0026309780|nr:histone deacetylase [Ferrimicrobium sp.]